DEPVIAVHHAAVKTMPVAQVDGYAIDRSYVGRTEPDRTSQLSLELGGLVTEVLADEGDRVRQGDVIARLDTAILQSRRDSVQAQVAEHQAALDEMLAGPRLEVIEAARADVAHWTAQEQLADVTRQRQHRLMTRGAGSQQDLDDAGFGQRSVEGRLLAAKARLKELENGTRQEKVNAQRAMLQRVRSDLASIDIQLAKSALTAPFSGRVSRRFVDEGAVIDAGSPVVELMETGRMVVRVGVPPESLHAFPAGSEQKIQLGGREVMVRVRSRRPDVNQQSRTVGVLMELADDSFGVRSGELVTVRSYQQIDRPGYWVPLSALSESHRGLWSVYVTVPADSESGVFQLRQRELELIHQTSHLAYVRGSLSDGELIVRDGVQRLVPGQLVRAVPPSDSIVVAGTDSPYVQQH
ncbi:MAG: efflux RND transporter periplasmic adaptor subunit, partial [Planctomycetota bacterium]